MLFRMQIRQPGFIINFDHPDIGILTAPALQLVTHLIPRDRLGRFGDETSVALLVIGWSWCRAQQR